MTKHHFWMLHKIRIDRNTVLSESKMHPVRLNFHLSLTFLQEQDITGYFCSCIILKCSIWKSNCSNKLGSFSKIFSNCRITFIKCTLCCYKCNNTSRSYLIKCLCKEIIMNTEIILIILCVIYLIISKWYISYCYIKEIIWILCLFKSTNSNIRFLI